MSKADGHLAIMKRLKEMPGAPNIVWEDDDGSTSQALPRIVLTPAGGSQRTALINGTTEAHPEVLAMVETEKGDFGRASRTIVNQIHARFTVNTRFDGLRVMDAPDERPPMPDSTIHRVPVYIRARINF